MSNAPIPSSDVADFKLNVEDFDALMNGAGTYVDRFGLSRLTVDEFFRRTGYEVPVAFSTGLSISRVTQTVTYGGITYHAIATAIPFTTTGTFNPAQWEVISGVSRQELASDSGASLVYWQGSKLDIWLGSKILVTEARFGNFTFDDTMAAAANSTAIQAALDYAYSIGGARVEIPAGKFYYSVQPTVPTLCSLVGAGIMATEGVKIGNNLDATYAVDALIHIEKASPGQYSQYCQIGGMTLSANTTTNAAYGLYAEDFHNGRFYDLLFRWVDRGVRAHDAWLIEWDNVTCNNVAGSAAGILAFNIQNGTSNSFRVCWSKRFATGYDLENCVYSGGINCGCDTFTIAAYRGGRNSTWMNCGAEDGTLDGTGSVFIASQETCTVVGGSAININASSGNPAIFFSSTTPMRVVGGFFAAALQASTIDIAATQNGGRVDVDNDAVFVGYRNVAQFRGSYNGANRISYANKDYSPDFTNGINTAIRRTADNIFRVNRDKTAVGSGDQTPQNYFTATSYAHENSYVGSNAGGTGTLEVLSFTNTGNTNSCVNLVVTAINSSGCAVYEAICEIVNGTPSAATFTKKYGAGNTGMTISWPTSTLTITTNTFNSRIHVDAKVFQRANGGEDRFTWK